MLELEFVMLHLRIGSTLDRNIPHFVRDIDGLFFYSFSVVRILTCVIASILCLISYVLLNAREYGE